MKDRLLKITISFLVGCAAAIFAGALSSLLWTRSFDALGLGLSFSLFAAPAVLGHVLASASLRFLRWRRIIYVGLMIPLPLGLLPVVLFPSEGASSDGADQMALAFIVVLLVAGIAGYAALEWRQRANGWRRTAAPLHT